jgi:hypothetical protein
VLGCGRENVSGTVMSEVGGRQREYDGRRQAERHDRERE